MSLKEYSGGGVTVMQLALSDARNRPFADIMRDDVLLPIGMVNSSFEQPIPPGREGNAARGHDRGGRAWSAKWHVYPEMAAAGLWTTPSDLARFVIEVQKSAQGESNRVLSRTNRTRDAVTRGSRRLRGGVLDFEDGPGLVFHTQRLQLGISGYACRSQSEGLRPCN